MTGQQVVLDCMHQKEKDDLAMSLRETAKKLESAAETLNSTEKDRREGGAVKRRREEDFEELEAKLEDATNAMRNFKRAKVSQEPTPEVGQRIQVQTKIRLISTQPALASAQPQGIPTTDNATGAEDEPDSGHHSLIITLKVPRLKSRASPSETVATQNLDHEASISLDRTKLQYMI